MQDATNLSLSNSLCPIQALPSELFLQIFLKNTELDDPPHNRLHTARRSSQVCRRWREQLLGYAPVWGRLLDLGYYERASDDWREEILSRTGEALLWITGSVTKSTSAFLFSVLEKKWQNVEILDITCRWNPAPGFRTTIRPILYKDAPNLALLNFHDSSANPGGLDEEIPSKPHSPALFNGFAPRLRHLKIFRQFYFDATAPWLSSLHSIVLLPYHTIPMILSILKSAPLLRCLRIVEDRHEMSSSMDYTDLAMVSMQHLESLELGGCPTYLESLLGSIDLPSGRAAKLRKLSIGTCNHQHSELSVRTLERVRRTIMKIIQAYLDDFPPQHLYLSDLGAGGSDRIFFIGDTRSWISPEGSNSLTIVLSLSCPLHSLILNLADSPGFLGVQELRTCPGESVELLVPLYKALHGVTDISVLFVLLDFLDAVDQHHLFPSLRILRWKHSGRLVGAVYFRLLEFLENRASSGLPLSILCIPEAALRGLPGDFTSRLYTVPGLTVNLTVQSGILEDI